mmetsp:Transcript_22209/g.38397  ORF Transcript_22209/g.38397 Transcript_22209/m.38397 type:complete len:92 (-) Transcript_22209:40-315(-)
MSLFGSAAQPPSTPLPVGGGWGTTTAQSAPATTGGFNFGSGATGQPTSLFGQPQQQQQGTGLFGQPQQQQQQQQATATSQSVTTAEPKKTK